jgi:hypothetical protein
VRCQWKGIAMIRISEADYGAAMSDHNKYIREAERLGPIWYDLKLQRAQTDADKPHGFRAFVVTQIDAISSFVSASLRIRRVAEAP